MKTSLALSLIYLQLFITIPTSSQTAYEWDHHGIGFEVADDFT